MDKEKTTFYRSHRWIGKRPQSWLKAGNDWWIVLTRDFRLRMERKPFKGTFCVAATTLHNGTVGSVPRILRQREWPSMKKVARADQATVRHLAAMETSMFAQHLAVLEHLAMLQYDDKTPRATGRLIIDVRGAAWSILCKDADSGMQLPVVGVTLDDCWDALQVHLASDNAPWEPDPWAKGTRPGKGKK